MSVKAFFEQLNSKPDSQNVGLKATEQFRPNLRNEEAVLLNEEIEHKTNLSTQCSTSVKSSKKALKRTGKEKQVVVMDLYLPKLLEDIEAEKDSKPKVMELE